MRRREFISLIGSVAAAWPVALKAQSTDRVRVIGILNILGPDDPEGKARIKVFEQTLQELGWAVGRDLKIEKREVGGDVDRIRHYAAELVALGPYAIFSIGSVPTASLQQATRTIPDRVYERHRSGWCWRRPKHGASGWQYDWLLEF